HLTRHAPGARAERRAALPRTALPAATADRHRSPDLGGREDLPGPRHPGPHLPRLPVLPRYLHRARVQLQRGSTEERDGAVPPDPAARRVRRGGVHRPGRTRDPRRPPRRHARQAVAAAPLRGIRTRRAAAVLASDTEAFERLGYSAGEGDASHSATLTGAGD